MAMFELPELMPHQKVAKEFIKEHPKCGIFLGVGYAKTLTTLSALYEISPPGHILVIAPLAIARSTWINEIEKWNIPIRTKSLMVDENDKKLTAAQRIEAIKQIPHDPPTMYFLSNDQIIRPSLKSNAFIANSNARNNPSFQELQQNKELLALAMFEEVESGGPLTRDELFEVLQKATTKTIPKSHLQKALRLLKVNELITTIKIPCQKCDGKGCPVCAAGLINQLPLRKELIGYKSNGARIFNNTVEWPFSNVIIDESQSMKKHSSNRFRALQYVTPQTTRLIELTGTPQPNNALDLWAQMYLIDQGASLGDNFLDYRTKYFKPSKIIDGHPVAWEPKPGAQEEIHNLIKPFVMSTTTNTIPLPDVLFDPNSQGLYPANKVNVTLSKELMEAYRDFAKKQILKLAVPDPKNPKTLVITADSAAILVNKLVQFASGTMYLESDEDDSTTQSKNQKDYVVIHDEKLQVLSYEIDNADSNVIVGYRFRSECEEIFKALTKEGRNVEIFDGSRNMIKRWNNKEIDVMLIHPASGGPGLNLQDGGHTLIWYTLPDSAEHFTQLNGRILRIGQRHPVAISFLATKGTRDALLAPKVLAPKLANQDHLLQTVHRSSDEANLTHGQDFDEMEEVLENLGINPLQLL